MLVCNRCGKENQDAYKFCLGCGSNLTALRAAPSPTPAPVSPPVPVALDDLGTRSDRQGLGDLVSGTSASLAGSAYAPQPKSQPRLPSGPVPELRLGGSTGQMAVATPAVAAAPVRHCPSCGKPVPWEFVFCGSCGTRLGAVAPPGSGPVRAAFTPSAPQPRGKLVLIRPDGGEGGSMPLLDGETLVGRNEGDLFESDSYLSPKHAFFVFRGGSLVVRDAGSLNGVFVKMSGEEEIADGEVFRLGQELLRFDVIRAVAPIEDGTGIMGSPNPGYWGRLSVILGRGQDGAAFPLFGDSMVVGRERGDILFPEDGYVSGTHARVSRRDGRYFLADLNSSNGSFLRIRGERVLKSGSFLLLGQQLFRVQYT